MRQAVLVGPEHNEFREFDTLSNVKKILNHPRHASFCTT